MAETIGPAGEPATGSPPFPPRAKKMLEMSLREALQLNHNYIGTEHLLLGLVGESEGVGTQVLINLGADLGRVRDQVLQLLSGYEAIGNPRAGVAGTYAPSQKSLSRSKTEAQPGHRDHAKPRPKSPPLPQRGTSVGWHARAFASATAARNLCEAGPRREHARILPDCLGGRGLGRLFVDLPPTGDA